MHVTLLRGEIGGYQKSTVAFTRGESQTRFGLGRRLLPGGASGSHLVLLKTKPPVLFVCCSKPRSLLTILYACQNSFPAVGRRLYRNAQRRMTAGVPVVVGQYRGFDYIYINPYYCRRRHTRFFNPQCFQAIITGSNYALLRLVTQADSL